MKRLIAAGAAALLGIAGAMTFAVPASASILDVSCIPPSSSTSTYSPALTNTPQPVNFSILVNLGLCVSTVPGLTSGISTANFTRTSSCTSLLSPASLIRTFTWNTGQTSTASVNQVTTVVAGVLTVVYTGTITGGLFAGDTIVYTVVGASTAILLCLLGLGTVPGNYGLVTVEITSI